jgi:hypothetical protein
LYCAGEKFTLINSLLVGNMADFGGGAALYATQVTTVLNSTFSGNQSTMGGGGLLAMRDHCRVANSIFWANHCPRNPQVQFSGTGSDRKVSNCVIEGGISGTIPAVGIIQSDPRFVSPGRWNDLGTPTIEDDIWTDGDYRLTASSPCIDAGDSTALPADVILDLDGQARFVDAPVPDTGVPGEGRAVVDIGPYEVMPTVLGRYIFYNNSAFDGRTAGAAPADDGAIAPDKSALLPGQTATVANYTNNVRGINGIMLDIAGLAANPSAADFEFSILGPTDQAWKTVPLPISISLRSGAGVGGSDRVTLIWTDKAMPNNHWLRIRVKSDPSGGHLGLAADDVFCFGLAIGETGAPVDGRTQVDATDLQDVRSHFTSGQEQASITNPFDVNRDGRVNIGDMIIVQTNRTAVLDSLGMISLPGGSQDGTGTETD